MSDYDAVDTAHARTAAALEWWNRLDHAEQLAVSTADGYANLWRLTATTSNIVKSWEKRSCPT